MSVNPPKKQPLENRSVFVACSARKISALSESLRELGASVIPLPVIKIREIEDKTALDNALNNLDRYSWIIFTSVYGVTYFNQRFHDLGINNNILKELKICAIGPATESALKEFGFRVNLVPVRFVAEGVVESLETYGEGLNSMAGSRILIPRAEQARDLLPDTLKAAGVRVDIVPCYRTEKAQLDPQTVQHLTENTPDLIVFTSSSTVVNMVEIMGDAAGRNLLQRSKVAAIGPITANTLESYGKQVEIVPKQSTIVSLIQSIEECFSG